MSAMHGEREATIRRVCGPDQPARRWRISNASSLSPPPRRPASTAGRGGNEEVPRLDVSNAPTLAARGALSPRSEPDRRARFTHRRRRRRRQRKRRRGAGTEEAVGEASTRTPPANLRSRRTGRRLSPAGCSAAPVSVPLGPTSMSSPEIKARRRGRSRVSRSLTAEVATNRQCWKPCCSWLLPCRRRRCPLCPRPHVDACGFGPCVPEQHPSRGHRGYGEDGTKNAGHGEPYGDRQQHNERRDLD